jgi:hypothetical protein
LFVDKDVSKTDETLHDECHLKQRKSTIRRLMWRLVLLSEQIESGNIDFIRICYEFFFSKFDSNTELLSTNSFKLNFIFNRENKHSDVWRLALIV